MSERNDSRVRSNHHQTLPKITLNAIAERREQSNHINNSTKNNNHENNHQSNDINRHSIFPIVPPKGESVVSSLPIVNDETPSWFVVLSPRETKGPTGPFSINQLKQLYKREEIADRTLVWRDGEKEWKPLVQQTYLKAQLTSLPPIPPRVANYNAELNLFQPFSKMNFFTDKEVHPEFLPLPEKDKAFRTCCQCGALAVYQTAEQPNQTSEIFKGQEQEEIGSNEHATEVIPGFLWIGNINAARPASIQSLGITLLINVSGYGGLIKSNPPYFRCKDLTQLREGYGDKPNDKQQLEILEIFEKIYDWIEFERLSSEKHRIADKKMKSPRILDTNEYGFPIRSSEDKPFRRPDPDATTPFFPPRVLIWSKDNKNRSCAVAISYLIKQHGMSLPFAQRFLANLKPQMDIEDAYLHLLRLWSEKYSLGYLLCADCAMMIDKKKNSAMKVQEITNEGIIEMKTNPVAAVEDPIGSEEGHSIEDTIEELSSTLQNIQKNTSMYQIHKLQTQSLELKPANLVTSALATSSIDSISAATLPHNSTSIATGVMSSAVAAAISTATSTANTTMSTLAEIDKILPLQSFIKPLYSNMFYDSVSNYSGLLDVCFNNQQLSDNTLSVLFQLMQDLSLLNQIRHLWLSDNQTKCLALKTLLLAFYPKLNYDPDNDLYLEDEPYETEEDSDDNDNDNDDANDDDESHDGTSPQKQKEKHQKKQQKNLQSHYKLSRKISLKRIPNITILDLSHNQLDEQGVRYLTFFLQQNSSLLTLNLFNNQLSDSFLSEVLTAFITPIAQFQTEGSSVYSSYHSTEKRQGGGMMQEKRIIQNNYFETDHFNQSVTELNIGRNTLGASASLVLERVIKQNTVLTSLNIEGCMKLTPKTLKRVTEAIRLYNPHIIRLFCDSLSLSVKSCEYLGKIQGKSKVANIRELSLSRCQLTSLHIKYLSKFLSLSRSLQKLDLSFNPIADDGMKSMAEILLGQVELVEMISPPSTKEVDDDVADDGEEEEEKNEERKDNASSIGDNTTINSPLSLNSLSFPSMNSVVNAPPIMQLDLSSCSLSSKGCVQVLQAIKKLGRPFYDLTLSFNAIKSDQLDFYVELSGTPINHLTLAYCQLQSRGGLLLLQILTPSCFEISTLNKAVKHTKPVPTAGFEMVPLPRKAAVKKAIASDLRNSLVYLNISQNEISDSIGPSLARCIQENSLLQEIDLSFNQITDKHRELYQEAVKVTSSAESLRKVDNLSIRLQGNPCHELLFDAPGMSRSKMRLTEGIAPNRFNSNGGGYDHIDATSREAFLIRRDLQYMMSTSQII